MSKNILLKTTVVLVVFLVGAVLAQAQTVRWVSNAGADSAACGTIASPCATFQQAHDNAANGGSVIALTDGSFGTLSITKPITIDGGGHVAFILRTTAGSAISVAHGGFGGTVVIRGLTIDGNVGNGTNGINYTSGTALIVENTVVRQFSNAGIFGNTSSTNRLSVSHSSANDNGIGILASPTGGVLTLMVDACELVGNPAAGLRANQNVNGTVSFTTASNSQFGHGFSLFTASGADTQLNFEDCVASNNAASGFISQIGGAGTATMRLSNCTVTGNDRGLFTSGGGQILSYGNNKIAGNNINGAPTGPIPQV